MKYSQVVIAIGGIALGVSATPISSPRQGFALRKAGETLETVAEGVDGGVGAVGSTAGRPHAVLQSHRTFQRNPSTQHSFMDSRISKSTAQALRADTANLKLDRSELRKENHERSAATRVPNAARAFDEELFTRAPFKAVLAGGRAATRAAGGSQEVGSSLGSVYGAYHSHKEAKAQKEARAFDEELFTRAPLKAVLAGGRAATRAAGGSQEVSSSLGSVYGAYQSHKESKAAKAQNGARDLEDEMLEVRGLVEAWQALWKPQSKEDKAKKLREEARLATEKAAAAAAALDGRDFFEMEDDLIARDFSYEMDELD